ncbi:hypothetical protein AWB76_06270 [Caballeronia temeraria]|uniref:Phosphoadenosine phosphosulphate reductase domain-containing protein n=1 Tax=Caballeronia temeraria TaxID=1777137 RepID=A0A158D0G0_9BURK|nr:phosphoadenosine phosphosulfate reductase family protein [Caballeronia temeraria]SAK88039.1 hypothetical protein AWB76_06270 [Caballeronia temeraria]
MNQKPRLLVSFSGGRTSAYMSKLLKAKYADKYELLFVFANTGQEHENTLIFVDRCDKEFGLNLVWVEAEVIHEARKGTSFRQVTFDTASRAGEPYEQIIRKYGIPNRNFPHCNRELKLRPIYAYADGAALPAYRRWIHGRRKGVLPSWAID